MDCAGRVQSVHSRHVKVQHYQARVQFFCLLYTLNPIHGFEDFEPFALKQRAHDVSHGSVVFDDEYTSEHTYQSEAKSIPAQ